MFVKLDPQVQLLLCCALCKGSLESREDAFVCNDCAMRFPRRTIARGHGAEHIYDFRVDRPAYSVPEGTAVWDRVQNRFEGDDRWHSSVDDRDTYLAEIESVREVYTEQFSIRGRVLDVGGHQGRLRHFLAAEEVPMYVSVDPYLDAFRDLDTHPNLLSAYPKLRDPCNFLACHAERLPFQARVFDWVHMRSVLDHFEDPYVAVREAFRVLRSTGSLLVGLTVRGPRSTSNDEAAGHRAEERKPLAARVARKLSREGFGGLLRLVDPRRRGVTRDGRDHTFHWRYEDLIDLVTRCEYATVKEHWQKPPYSSVIYLQARKR